jgi:hypothetical protein
MVYNKLKRKNILNEIIMGKTKTRKPEDDKKWK